MSRRRSRSQAKGRVRRRAYAKTPLQGLPFETLEQAQAYRDRWDTHWADTRIHGTTKRQVAAMCAEERPALQPLPVEPFRYYRFGVRTVHLDGCLEVEAANYSTPPEWIGQRVQVQWTDLPVRVQALRRRVSCCASMSGRHGAGLRLSQARLLFTVPLAPPNKAGIGNVSPLRHPARGSFGVNLAVTLQKTSFHALTNWQALRK